MRFIEELQGLKVTFDVVHDDNAGKPAAINLKLQSGALLNTLKCFLPKINNPLNKYQSYSPPRSRTNENQRAPQNLHNTQRPSTSSQNYAANDVPTHHTNPPRSVSELHPRVYVIGHPMKCNKMMLAYEMKSFY